MDSTGCVSVASEMQFYIEMYKLHSHGAAGYAVLVPNMQGSAKSVDSEGG